MPGRKRAGEFWKTEPTWPSLAIPYENYRHAWMISFRLPVDFGYRRLDSFTGTLATLFRRHIVNTGASSLADQFSLALAGVY